MAARIKTHHNVGGLPEDEARLIEPLRYLFKDEVRQVGAELGLPEEIVWRHPFPGPGLAVRVIGEVTPERVALLQEADAIFIEEIRAAGLYRDIAQAFAVLLPACSVGVMGDQRTYACGGPASSDHPRLHDRGLGATTDLLARLSTVSSMRCPASTAWSTSAASPRHHRMDDGGLLPIQ